VASGAKTDRAQLRKAIAALHAGDVLMVTRLDRLARSTRNLLNTLAVITGRKAISRLMPCQTAGQVARAAQIRQLRAELGSRHDREEARYRAQQRLSHVGCSVA
jgi:DNA invertase Pin-like site-specific DNA recombinase